MRSHRVGHRTLNKEKTMGRPLNHRHFGDLNPDFVGGEGLASITLGGTNNSSGYTTGDALTINAPQIAGGTQAVGTVTAYGNGKISGTSITTTGSGYTSFTISAGTGTQGTLTLTGVATTGAGLTCGSAGVGTGLLRSFNTSCTTGCETG